MKTPPRRKKPRNIEGVYYSARISGPFPNAKGAEYQIHVSSEGGVSTEARRLAKWLTQFADWAESGEVLPKKGGARG